MRVNFWNFGVILILAISSVPDNALAEKIEYKGFSIEAERQDDQIKLDTTLSSIYGQIDIVEYVNLPIDVTKFFKERPIIVDYSLRGPGEFDNGRVLVRPDRLDNVHPVVLHEYLHALHSEKIGLSNPDIVNAYHRAVEHRYYPDTFGRAHFLENEREYFAVLGTIYLFTNIQQPPYNCDVLKNNDPAFIMYLASVLGKHHGCD